MFEAVAIIIEWENALLSELDRARRMLQQLALQVGDYARKHNTRFELIVIYNPEYVERSIPETAVRSEIDPATWPGTIRFLDAPGLHYYDQKTFGASQTTAEIVLFLDSDVIPDSGWLAFLLDGMNDPSTQIIGGQTYLTDETFFDRVFAGFWFFRPKNLRPGIYDAHDFYANNVAFRREFFQSHSFPKADCYRGQCAQLSRVLRAKGEKIRIHGEAFVTHPAPDGFMHAMKRAIAHGYDRVYWMRTSGKAISASPIGAFYRLLKGFWLVIRRVPHRAWQLGLNPVTALASALMGLVFHAAIFCSEVVSYFFPAFVRRHVHI
jgi:hypothetical protein